MQTYVSCTVTIDYGQYVQATYKTWEGRKLTFEGKVNRDTVCCVKKEWQSKYPGSFKEGLIKSIREDGNGLAEFWICFPSELKGLFYTSWVSFTHIDWEEYFKYSKKNWIQRERGFFITLALILYFHHNWNNHRISFCFFKNIIS